MFERVKSRLFSSPQTKKVEEEQREQWDRPIEFILSLIGCSIGEKIKPNHLLPI